MNDWLLSLSLSLPDQVSSMTRQRDDDTTASISNRRSIYLYALERQSGRIEERNKRVCVFFLLRCCCFFLLSSSVFFVVLINTHTRDEEKNPTSIDGRAFSSERMRSNAISISYALCLPTSIDSAEHEVAIDVGARAHRRTRERSNARGRDEEEEEEEKNESQRHIYLTER